MKNILVLLLLFVGTTTFAQKGGLTITSLNNNAKANNMDLKKATQTGPQSYVVVKLKDSIHDFKILLVPVLKHSALHPRLKVPMKSADLLFFVAEHDDHHLATIKEIVEAVGA